MKYNLIYYKMYSFYSNDYNNEIKNKYCKNRKSFSTFLFTINIIESFSIDQFNNSGK